jgi:hypothetical protein
VTGNTFGALAVMSVVFMAFGIGFALLGDAGTRVVGVVGFLVRGRRRHDRLPPLPCRHRILV